jgi:hypothetical protein
MDLIYLQYTRFEHSTSVSNIAKEKRMGNTPFDHITYFFNLILWVNNSCSTSGTVRFPLQKIDNPLIELACPTTN